MSVLKNNRVLIVDDQVELRERMANLLIDGGDSEKSSSQVKNLRQKLLNPNSDNGNNHLSKSKYIVDTVGKGQDALEIIISANNQNKPYALAFIDMRMPTGWDGLKTAQEIRKIDKDIEIVMMTAFADYKQKDITEHIGYPEKLLYIKKPFNIEEILQMTLSLCSKWSILQEQKENNIILESLLKSLYHLRTSSKDKIKELALISVVDFLKAPGGILLQWDCLTQKWQIKESQGNISADKIKNFICANSNEMYQLSTRKHFGPDYFIPFGKEHCYAMVLFNPECKTSSHWYQIFDLLTMSIDIELAKLTL